MPPGNREDTGTMPGVKASPLLSGLSSRESLTNRSKDAKQMEAEQSAGAASDVSGHWREVDWRSVTGEVRRLQVRIVKAVETGRWGRVKALQRLLTTSRSGKLLAVRRVTENQGRKTPGVDGESWDTPEKKIAAVGTLRGRGYRPLPLRRIYIPKSNGKRRPLGIPTMKDRAMQALHLLALDPVAETTADQNSYGFVRSAAARMRSTGVRSHSDAVVPRRGYSKAISGAVSTTSAMTGYWPTSPWTGPSCESG